MNRSRNNTYNIIQARFNCPDRRVNYLSGLDSQDTIRLIDLFKSVNDELSDIPETDVIDIMKDCRKMFESTNILRITPFTGLDENSDIHLPYTRMLDTVITQPMPVYHEEFDYLDEDDE